MEENIQNQVNDITKENEQNTNPNNNRGKKIAISLMIIIIIFILGIGISGGFLLSQIGKNNENKTQNATSTNSNETEDETNNYVEEDTALEDTSNSKDSKNGYAELVKFAGKGFENKDYDTTTNNIKEYCELTFDNLGYPCVKIGSKSAETTECSFYTKEISNMKSDGAAGTTYVAFDFTAWTPGGDTTGSATLSYSNVADLNEITVSAKVKINDKDAEFNNIKVRPVGQTAVEKFTLPEFKNRVYESEKKENSFWYKLEFDENGKPTITEGYLAGEVSQIVDTYRRFTDVSSEGAAGSVYVTFSYRVLNETGEKVEGRLHYSNNTNNKEIYLKMYNKENKDNEIILKQVK